MGQFLKINSDKCNSNLAKIKTKTNNQIFKSIGAVGIELLGNSTDISNSNFVVNTLDIYQQELLLSKQIKKYENQLEKLNEYLKHYSEQLMLFSNIKTIGKQIDKTFLMLLFTYISIL